MKLDKLVLDDIIELSKTDIKQAKQELFEYAGQFNVKLKKNMSIENMIQHLEESQPTEGVISVKNEDISNEDKVSDLEAEPEVVVQENTEEVTEVITAVEPIKQEVVEQKNKDPKDIYMFSGYLSVPYWIADWILETKDWKTTKCPWKGSEKFIRTILYYISKDKQICIRETRNSKFITLK